MPAPRHAEQKIFEIGESDKIDFDATQPCHQIEREKIYATCRN